MPLIYCPSCNRITYAYSVYGDEGEVVGYRCSLCYNRFNYDQVNVITFPNVVITINTSFRKFIAEVDRVDEDDITEEGDALAERFLACLLFLARPREVNVYRRGVKWLVKYVAWDYRGTRDADERNEEVMENVMRVFAKAVDDGYVTVEVREMDEGDSVFFAVRSHQDADVIEDVLRLYGFMLGFTF